VVAVMWMSLRCDSDKTIRARCIPGAPSLRILTRNVNPYLDSAVPPQIAVVSSPGHGCPNPVRHGTELAAQQARKLNAELGRQDASTESACKTRLTG
jgi:hypothetical protein